jgi:hypothetical protein
MALVVVGEKETNIRREREISQIYGQLKLVVKLE